LRFLRFWSSGASLVLLLAASGCGRYFPTPLTPTPQQADGMTVNDDGSITYNLDRLAVTLRPMTDEELNRQVNAGDLSVNPYTFGDLQKSGEDFTPTRFTVFRLQVENYQFPKVRVDPQSSRIVTGNERDYAPLSFGDLYDYFRAHWVGRTGQGRSDFRARTDVLKRTLYPDAYVFSGSDLGGYVVYPRLHDDVRRIDVQLEDVAVRFNYADEPVETVDLSFAFERDVLRGYTPADAVSEN
jgi:hypothetical protein